MKFAIEIKMDAEVEIKDITSATVIRNLVQPAKPKSLVLEEIMDDRHFEIAARNQRLLAQLRADRALLLRYGKLIGLFEALSALEGTDEKEKIADKMDDLEISLVNRLNYEDKKWFRNAMKLGVWSESTEQFGKAFHVSVSSPQVKAKCVRRR